MVHNYDIRYDDKYGQLAQIDIAAEGEGYEPTSSSSLPYQGVTIPRGVVHRPRARGRTVLLIDGRARDGDPDRERLTESGPRCRRSTVEMARPQTPSELFCESNQLPHEGCVSSPFSFAGP
ncbi:MAG: hypothetical protein ACLP0J_21955 [Solirubrobacteraceae bacterium]|jgi:hypothetical protein